MKRSLSALTVVVSMLALTGCPSSGGGGSQQQVNQTNVGGSCSISSIDSGTYSCTETINNVTYNTNSVSYFSRQDLCTKLGDNYSYINKDNTQGQVTVASGYRSSYVASNCQNGTGTGTGTIPGAKTFTCQVQASRGDAVSAGQAQQYNVFPGNNAFLIQAPATIVRQKCGWLGCATVTEVVSLANVKVKYIPGLPGSTGSMDKITMSTQVDGNTIEVSGFAGTETKIESAPQDSDNNETSLIVTCVSSDANARTSLASSGLYQCKGEERVNGRSKVFNYTNQLADVVNNGISITNSVFVQGSGDEVSYSQSAGSLDSTVNIKSSLSSKSSVKIDKGNYSLKVECQPK